jgi:transposase
MILGVDIHKHTHTAALLERASGEVATLTFANSSAGIARLRSWLAERGGSDALVGIENAAGYGRPLVAALVAAGHEVLTVPSWRTHRDRDLVGPGKSDAGDATAIAEVVLRKRSELGPAAEHDMVRAMALFWRRSAVSLSPSAPRRSSGCGRSGPRSIPRPSEKSFIFIASARCENCAASALGAVARSRPPPAAFASLLAKSPL